MPGQLGNGPCQFHTGWPSTYDHKGHQRLPPRGIGFLFGLFVGGEEALTYLQGALQTVQAWRIGSPVLMAKVLVVGTSGDDEGVVGQLPTAVDHPTVLDVKSRHFPHERTDILSLPEDLTQWYSNIAWRET